MERDDLTAIMAQNLERLMELRKTNAAALARDAGVNPTGVYDILSGKSKSPKLVTINKIATALRVPPSALFEKEGEADLRQDILSVYLRLEPEERKRLLLTAEAWLGTAQAG